MSILDAVRDARHRDQVTYLTDEHGIGHANALVAVYRSEHGL